MKFIKETVRIAKVAIISLYFSVKIFIKQEKRIATIALISMFFCVIFIFTNRIPEPFTYCSEIMTFGYSLSLSIMAAVIFFYFQVFVPRQKRKSIIISNFKHVYNNFKWQSIFIFMQAGECLHEQNIIEELYDHEKFRKYFLIDCGNGQSRWDMVFNNLNNRLLEDLLNEMNILRDEISYLVNNIDFYNEKYLAFFKILSERIYRLKNINIEYDDKKTLFTLLWEIFAKWSFWGGNPEDLDVIAQLHNMQQDNIP